MGAGVNVSACLVTDGKHDMQPVLDSLPDEWEKIIYSNEADSGRASVWRAGEYLALEVIGLPDLSVYGRYAAIEYASHDLIYVQDDDVIVSDPQAIVDKWIWESLVPVPKEQWSSEPGTHKMGRFDHVVCNMPQEFRHDGYKDSALVGFGACFHRDAPKRAFERWANWFWTQDVSSPFVTRECDTVFTMLTPRVLVDVPKQDREFASDPDRLWKQPGHAEQRERMRQLVRQVRDDS